MLPVKRGVYGYNRRDGDRDGDRNVKYCRRFRARRHNDFEYNEYNRLLCDPIVDDRRIGRWVDGSQQLLSLHLHPYVLCQLRFVHECIFQLSNRLYLLLRIARRRKRRDRFRLRGRDYCTRIIWNITQLGEQHLQLFKRARLLQSARIPVQCFRERVCGYCNVHHRVCGGWQ